MAYPKHSCYSPVQFQPTSHETVIREEQLFHHLVAKLFYLCRQTQQDIQTAWEFSCNRLRSIHKDDYKKLTKVMQYLHGSLEWMLTI